MPVEYDALSFYVLSEQIGLSMETGGRATTFADIERAIAG